MDKVKYIFNHPRKTDSEKDYHLFDWRRPSFHKDDVGQLNRLLKKLGNSRCATLHMEKSEMEFNTHVFSEGFESNRRQRVISKVSYSFSKQKHLNYLKKYMPQMHIDDVTQKPELFGTDFDEYQAHMVPFHYKLIISPENQNVDLKILTHHFIERLQNLTGYDLYWEAAIHTNTEHRHAHLAINGVDKNGQKVRFTREMIKEQMRTILSEAATNMIGERSYEEIKAEEAKLPLASRWTRIDERLSLYNGKLYPKVLDVSLQQRLAYLYQFNLAEKDGEFYSLKSDWKEKLQIFGRYNSFMTEYLNNHGNLTLYQGGVLNGIVEKTITFDKDESWNDAIVVKSDQGRFYVPIYNLYKDDIEGKRVQIDMPYFSSMKKISDKEIKIQRKNNNSSNIER